MSYDLDSLHMKYGIQIYSVAFATTSDVAGTTVIPGVAGQMAVIHQVAFMASAWSSARLERATGAASSYWNGFAGQTQIIEGTRVQTDSGASVFADVTGAGASCGLGVLKVWYTYQVAKTSGGAGIGNL